SRGRLLMSEAYAPLEIFCSCAPADKGWCRRLETHLRPLIRQGKLAFRARHLITAGTDYTGIIHQYITVAPIVLVLVSPDYFASDACVNEELPLILEHAREYKKRVIPILIRPLGWMDPRLKHLQALPSTGQPITSWKDREAAWADVVIGIRETI